MHPSWRQGCGKINKRFFFGLTFTINFGTKFFCFFAKAFFCFSFFWNRAVSPPSSQSCKYTSIVWVERTVLPSMVCVFDPSVCLSMQPPVEYSKNRNHGMAKKGSPSRRNAPSNPLPTHPFSVCLPCSWGFPPHSLKNLRAHVGLLKSSSKSFLNTSRSFMYSAEKALSTTYAQRVGCTLSASVTG